MVWRPILAKPLLTTPAICGKKITRLSSLKGFSSIGGSGLVTSKSESRRLIEQNGISLNQKKISSVEQIITDKDLKDNSLVLQKGKKVFLKIIFK